MIDALRTDWNIVEEAADGLEAYLPGENLYWPVQGGRLSPGNLVVAMKRLQAKGDAVGRLNALMMRIENAKRRWPSAWRNKARLEFEERLRFWHGFLKEADEEKRMEMVDYKTQIRVRVILQLLANEFVVPASEMMALDAEDERLRTMTEAGDFAWAADLSSGFDEAEFWFLYRKPRMGNQGDGAGE